MSRLPHFFRQLTDGGKIVSHTSRPPFTLRKIPGTHFCWDWVNSRVIVQLERLGKLKKIHLIGIQSRDFPACSILLQPIALQRTLQGDLISLKKLKGGYTDGQTQTYSKVVSYASFCFFQNKESSLKQIRITSTCHSEYMLDNGSLTCMVYMFICLSSELASYTHPLLTHNIVSVLKSAVPWLMWLPLLCHISHHPCHPSMWLFFLNFPSCFSLCWS
jgi:hypothetical protein